MKQIVEWSLTWEKYAGTGWQHHLVCRTSEQEMLRFNNQHTFRTFDDNLLATDLDGEQYQFDRAGFVPGDDRSVSRRSTSLELAVDWIRQYWTQNENDLFTYIGHDGSVDGDAQEFYQVTLKRPMGDLAAGTKFLYASAFLTAKGISFTFHNYGSERSTFIVGWSVTEIKQT